jgi:adenylate cyclase
MSGVEIPVTLLFSDVGGSTAMGERMRPTEFQAFLDHFYRVASDAILAHDGLVDKTVGDEVIALFFGESAGRTTRPPR